MTRINIAKTMFINIHAVIMLAVFPLPAAMVGNGEG
jgi:hypothetical protein